MHVAILGVGLIGGSIASGLAPSHDVTCFDPDDARRKKIAEIVPGVHVAESATAAAANADLVIIGAPVGEIGHIACEVLRSTDAVVTDVGSVKVNIVAEVAQCTPEQRARFVGGHPMAGSEQDGLAGADPHLFENAVWITTPTEDTRPDALGRVQDIIHTLGAQQVALGAAEHDALVALISHVPQLVASSLMGLAAEHADRPVLSRLAAGGFRDMTRIAASHPAIWPDICVANREAILRALNDFSARIDDVRGMIESSDRAGLLGMLDASRNARRSLPVGASLAGPLSELRIPIPDRPGVLAEITAAASALGVNISDIETTHSPEGDRGVVVLLVRSDDAPTLEARLQESGYRVSSQHVSAAATPGDEGAV